MSGQNTRILGPISSVLAVAATAVLTTVAAVAEPVTDEFAASAQVVAANGCALLNVQFHYRVQDIAHFPPDRGQELRVTLRPIDPVASDLKGMFPRQGVPIERADLAGIDTVTVDFDQAIGPTLRVLFNRQVAFDLSHSENFESILVAVPRPGSSAICKVSEFPPPTAGPGAGPAAPPNESAALPQQRAGKTSAADIKTIEASMDEARFAMRKKNYKEAIALIEKVLAYPENPHTPDALMALGEARQLAGQTVLADAAFREYLRRYPDAGGAASVAKRLGLPPTARPGGALGPDDGKDRGKTHWFVSGSASSFYVSDDSTTTAKDISIAPNPTADPDSHLVHQNTILNNIDLYGSIDDDNVRTKFKLSGVVEKDMSTGANEQDRAGFSTAYIESNFKSADITTRIGRQTLNGAGVIGRFDGADVYWQTNSVIRLGAVAGAANWSSFDTPFLDQRYLLGANIDFANFPPGSDVSFFAIQQTDKWILDRRAIGAEFRYFRDNKSVLGLIDYDIHFQTLNAAAFSGSWTFDDKSILSTALDYRRVPYLSTWSALQGQPFTTLYDMLRFNTLDQLQQYAIDRTPVFSSAMVSYSKPLSETLQASADFTITNMSGTPPSGGVDGTMPSGTEFYVSGQLMGSNVLKPGDLYVGALRYAHLAGSNVYFMDLNSRYPWSENFQISPRLRVGYQEGSAPQLKETTVLPSILFDYMYDKNLSFESEVGVKWIDSNAGGLVSNTKDFYFTLGVRSDFSAEGSARCVGMLSPCPYLWFGGGLTDQQAKSDRIYYSPAVSKPPTETPLNAMFAIESGSRYWFSQGQNRYNYYADSTPTQRVSALNYASNATHTGEAYVRADIRQGLLRNVFLRGYLGGGLTQSGTLTDEDFPPLTSPYSKTVSNMSGRLGYWGLDIGYNLYTTDRFRLGGFAGYQQFMDVSNAGGCTQVAGSPICAIPIPSSVRLVSEQDRWNSLRVGAIVDVNVTDRLKWKNEFALSASSQHALDNHFATFGRDPANGQGGGFQIESSLNYRVADNWDIGAGARWWRFNNDLIDNFGQLLRYQTDRYGVFAQASYHFNWAEPSSK